MNYLSSPGYEYPVRTSVNAGNAGNGQSQARNPRGSSFPAFTLVFPQALHIRRYLAEKLQSKKPEAGEIDERNCSSLAKSRSRNSLGAIAFLARNWRLKFDRFSNPESKQISATVLSVSRNF